MNQFPLGIRLEVLPGNSLSEKFDYAAKAGYDGVELPGRFLGTFKDELISTYSELSLPVSSISLGFRGSLISNDPEIRNSCIEDIRELIQLCELIHADGIVIPPALFFQEAPRDQDNRLQENKWLIDGLDLLSQASCNKEIGLWLEPVNRYESNFINTIGEGCAIVDLCNSPLVGLTADFFHMRLEELSPWDSIKNAGRRIKHVHIAENTRVEPCRGDMDIRGGMKALKEVGYMGWVVVECRSLSEAPGIALGSCAKYVRECITFWDELV